MGYFLPKSVIKLIIISGTIPSTPSRPNVSISTPFRSNVHPSTPPKHAIYDGSNVHPSSSPPVSLLVNCDLFWAENMTVMYDRMPQSIKSTIAKNPDMSHSSYPSGTYLNWLR